MDTTPEVEEHINIIVKDLWIKDSTAETVLTFAVIGLVTTAAIGAYTGYKIGGVINNYREIRKNRKK